MPLRTFLLIAAIVEGFFGIGFLLVPNLVLAPMGVSLSPEGLMVTRILGAALFSFGLLFWWGRDAAPSEVLTAVFRAATVYFAVSAIPLLLGTLAGLANALGWGTFVLHILLAFGFWNFGFRK